MSCKDCRRKVLKLSGVAWSAYCDVVKYNDLSLEIFAIDILAALKSYLPEVLVWGHSVIRYIVCIIFSIDIAKWIQSYILLTETVLICNFLLKGRVDEYLTVLLAKLKMTICMFVNTYKG